MNREKEPSQSLEIDDMGQDWETEIQRRIAEVDAGRVTTVPAEEVYARLRQRLGGR